jgi:hypothetical protein
MAYPLLFGIAFRSHEGFEKGLEDPAMANVVRLSFPNTATVFVQAVSNASYKQAVTITPPSGTAAVFSGSGEYNARRRPRSSIASSTAVAGIPSTASTKRRKRRTPERAPGCRRRR